jgi:branched-chain amino acid transport system substrate-binding protein
MKKHLSTSSLALAIALLASCAPTKEPIKIGYIGPLTGEAASYGADTLNGTKLAIEEINAAGGINGREVVLIAEDGRCTGADAASAAQKLVNIDGVIAIIGGQCSGETLAAAPIAEAGQVVMISPVSSSPDVTEAGDFIFRDYPSDALKTKAMATYLAKEGFAKMAMMTENTDFATAFRNALTADLGEEHIVFNEVVEPGTKDFRTLITRLKATDFDIFFPNAQSDAVMAAMMQQLREQDLTQTAITHDVGDSATLGEIATEAVEGLLVIAVPSAGEDGSFGATYKEKFGEAQATMSFAAHAYDAMNVLAKVMETAGTTGTAIRDGLYALQGHTGIVGTFHFDENGDVVGIPYALKTFQNGKIVTLESIPTE